jgi:ATP-binding cassette, subfamily B, bacterial
MSNGVGERLRGAIESARAFAAWVLAPWPPSGLFLAAGALREAVVAAACRAGADRMLAGLPDAEKTLLGGTYDEGGADLSGGQWQRLAIGRAYMREAAVLVLDEPTAALDARAEVAVYRQFRDAARGRTTLLISHRLGSARLADRIVVLEGGRVAEAGSHAELLARGGAYAELYHAQAEWYR